MRVFISSNYDPYSSVSWCSWSRKKQRWQDKASWVVNSNPHYRDPKGRSRRSRTSLCCKGTPWAGATDIITGTFTLRTFPLFSLIHSSSTHSYVLSELTNELGILIETIDKGMTVTSLFGDSVLVNRVYRWCPLIIQGHVFYANLIELPFYGFNVILGMDWLT